MKIGVGKRILMFLHWLFSILICAALVVSLFFPNLIDTITGFLKGLMGPAGNVGMIVIGILIAVVYAALCIAQAGMIFRRSQSRADRGFIMIDSSDNSRVRIAISAIEQMVRQSVNSIDGISDMKIAISSVDDAIEINVNACIIAGRHVPTITLNMQQAIRRFVEMNCGVAVRTVAVSINSVTSAETAGKRKHRAGKGAKAAETAVPVIVPVIEPVEAPEAEAEYPAESVEEYGFETDIADAEIIETAEAAVPETEDVEEPDESWFPENEVHADSEPDSEETEKQV